MERFGLRVALNSLGENNVRSIEKRTFDAISRYSREQASREATARDFELDIEQDLLRAITGTPTESELGKRMSGMDALHASVPATLEDLHELLVEYHKKYLDDSYKQRFPWVEHIAEVASPGLIDALNSQLVGRITDGNQDGIWMAPPDALEWEKVSGFRWPGRKQPDRRDVDLEGFLESLPNPDDLSLEHLKARKVMCIDDDGTELDSWSTYRCVQDQIDFGGESYLLSDGKWYCLAQQFVRDVNAAYDPIPRYDQPLPQYQDETEGAYNERVAQADVRRYALMDTKLVYHGGATNGIEVCDLFARGQDIIHVKRHGASSVLSHLFSQGTVSGELFQADIEFRRKLNRVLPTGHRLANPDQPPTSKQYQVVFAVISSRPGALSLPFFSRLNLRHAVRRLEGYGYRVALAKIEVDRNFAIAKRYPTRAIYPAVIVHVSNRAFAIVDYRDHPPEEPLQPDLFDRFIEELTRRGDAFQAEVLARLGKPELRPRPLNEFPGWRLTAAIGAMVLGFACSSPASGDGRLFALCVSGDADPDIRRLRIRKRFGLSFYDTHRDIRPNMSSVRFVALRRD